MQGRRARHLGDPPRSEGARSPRACSARISTTGSTSSRSRCRPCASGRAICRCWSQHFLKRFARRGARCRRSRRARGRRWSSTRSPGNVREFSHAIEHAVRARRAAARSSSQHLPASVAVAWRQRRRGGSAGSPPLRPLSLAVKEFEREYLLRAIRLAEGRRGAPRSCSGSRARASGRSCGSTGSRPTRSSRTRRPSRPRLTLRRPGAASGRSPRGARRGPPACAAARPCRGGPWVRCVALTTSTGISRSSGRCARAEELVPVEHRHREVEDDEGGADRLVEQVEGDLAIRGTGDLVALLPERLGHGLQHLDVVLDEQDRGLVRRHHERWGPGGGSAARPSRPPMIGRSAGAGEKTRRRSRGSPTRNRSWQGRNARVGCAARRSRKSGWIPRGTAFVFDGVAQGGAE